MNILEEGGSAIINLGSFLQPIIALGPELKRIGSLADYEASLKSSILNLEETKKSTNAGIAASRSALNQEKQTHIKNVNDFNTEKETARKASDKYKSDKRIEAGNIIDEANADAVTIKDVARAEAKKIIDDAEQFIKDQKVKIEEQTKTILALDKDIAERNKALSDINQKLSALVNA